MTKSIIGTGTNLPSGRTALNSNFDELYASYVFLSGATPAPVGDGATDDSAALANAHTTAGVLCEVVIKSPTTSYFLNTTATYAAAQRIQRGAVLKIGTTKTVTFTGPLVDGLHRMFDTSAATAAVSFVGNNFVPYLRPEWWGAVAGTDTAPIAALNGAAMAACMVAHVASGIPMLLRSGAVYYTDRELQATAGYCIAVNAPGWRATLKLSSTLTPGAVRSCLRVGHSSAGSVGDQCFVDSLFLDANFRGVDAWVFAGGSLGRFNNMRWANALSHGVRLKPLADGGGPSINDGNVFTGITWMENNGTIYASPGVVANYSSDHTGGLVVSCVGATMDSTAVITGGKTTLTMNGFDVNNMTYLEALVPLRIGTGANRRSFVVDSWTRVSAVQATFSCWVASAANSPDNQPLALTGQDFAIGCGDNGHEDIHNDNNNNVIECGISRSPAGFSWAIDGLYGTVINMLQCDQQMFWAYRIGHNGGVIYYPKLVPAYVEPTGQGIHRRAIALFAAQGLKVDGITDGMSAGGQSAGEGHIDYFPNGAQVSGELSDAGGTVGLGSNSWINKERVSNGDFALPFLMNCGGYAPSYQALTTADLTLSSAGPESATVAITQTIRALDTSAANRNVALSSTLPVGAWWVIGKGTSDTNTVTFSGASCTVNGQNTLVLTRDKQFVLIWHHTGGNFYAIGFTLPTAKHSPTNATVGATTAAVGDLTGAAMVFAKYSAVGAAALTTRTAAQMFAEHPDAKVGDTYVVRITNSSATGPTTLTGGTGVTVNGTATMAATSWREYTVKFTGAATMTFDSEGAGTL